MHSTRFTEITQMGDRNMFWEATVSDHLLIEMYKFAVLNRLDPEFTLVMLQEIKKRKLDIGFYTEELVVQ